MKFAEWAVLVFVVLMVAIPVLWVTAHLQVCGWKGLFVECRIMDCQK